MATTYEELWRRVLTRLDKRDGTARIASQEAVNDAHKAVARVKDFDDLMVLDQTNAATVADTASYHLTTDWGLTRPKDIHTLRLMDTGNSRKLTYIPPSKVDDVLPYVEILGSLRSKYYTRRGMDIELIPIPESAYPIYVYYSQWPLPLVADDDESSYANANIDDVLIELSTDMTEAYIEGSKGHDWDTLALRLLSGALHEERTRPDEKLVAQPFSTHTYPHGEYWKMPFIRRDPDGSY